MLTVCAPAIFQVTVMLFVPKPAVITPPGDIDQVYALMLASVVYMFPVEFTQAAAGPVIVGTGRIFTVTGRLELDPFVQAFVPYTVTFPEVAARV
jgi:methylglyoxal synthase